MRLEAIGNRGFHSRLTPLASRLIRSARVARLATADRKGRPHVIPICFAFDGKALYSPVDEKPKRSPPLRLKRVRNILENPHVAVVVDRYDENWKRLAYVLIRGRARLLTGGENYRRAVLLLRKKYPQYRRMAIEERPMIRIMPTRVTSWGKL
ncbi:MAG: TIGR03668 family PPOX class F420-dependent oxidoreductase [Deltaproteobacteria bacterium]|nr:TIGR03668 family PPOX class F420-dependent oxidoreductase [Deltaproteobacteria bacterium]